MSKRGLGTNPFKTNSVASIFSATEHPGGDMKDATSISLSSIQLPAQQPRRYFDLQKLQQLAESIRAHGILEPLLVRPLTGDRYELVAGERRYRAAKEVGLQEVPVVMRELSDLQAVELALIENLQREDLNPVEETEGILTLLSAKLGMPTHEVSQLLHRLAKRSSDNVVGSEATLELIEAVFQMVGKMSWESFASHRLPLLNLPQTVLEALRAGKIEYTKARALARIKDPEALNNLLEQTTTEQWSLNQIRAAISEATQPVKSTGTKLKDRFSQVSKTLKASTVWEDADKHPQLEQLLDELQRLAKGTF